MATNTNVTQSNENVKVLRNKLKSATKLKLSNERDVYKLRNLERSLNEEFTLTKHENQHMKEILQELKNEISKAEHQLIVIDVCKSSEKMKIQAHIDGVRNHEQEFQGLFNKENDRAELANKSLREKQAEQLERKTLRHKELVQKNEQLLQESLLIEAEADGLEQECVVLKKRNTAIMLKLRRKLIETEDMRRELSKEQQSTSTCN